MQVNNCTVIIPKCTVGKGLSDKERRDCCLRFHVLGWFYSMQIYWSEHTSLFIQYSYRLGVVIFDLSQKKALCISTTSIVVLVIRRMTICLFVCFFSRGDGFESESSCFHVKQWGWSTEACKSYRETVKAPKKLDILKSVEGYSNGVGWLAGLHWSMEHLR